MKNNKYKNLKSGIFTLLPIIIFIEIIKWCIDNILKISDNLFLIFPHYKFTDINNQIFWYWHAAGIVAMIVIIWSVGWLMNHYYIGKKINALIQPMIKRTPILNTLTRMSKQINEISQNKSSFKEVVLVEFPGKGKYSIGFITSESIDVIENLINKKVYSVFIPTTPNPTNGFLCVVPEDELIRTKIPIAKGFEYVISMGTLIDLESIEKINKAPE